ncbi:polynucleotide kinase-phosphatase [Bacillus sp. B15-48]|uniref:polynucleotide kinase-phosphatase n=1 Tax=Bacillus sp. B15-48 TaxID=1548601 RepID=UPI00193F402A|nr:polynucleotide kinase-phosphatase [Bacillus sp. B15-48]MBM4761304.1 polynucleotide kinase-phosphatase [Bacillus sp. B15-48]
MSKKIMLPYAGIVLLIGPSNSGKTTFLKKWTDKGVLQASEIVSSDQFRLLVADNDFIEWSNRPKDEADVLFEEYKLISKHAFDAMDSMIIKRAQLGRLTIIDATHLHAEDRKKYIEMAKEHHIPCVAIVFDLPQEILLERDENRDFPRGKKRVKQQVQIFAKNKRFIQKEGFRFYYSLKLNEVEAIDLVRETNPIERDVGVGLDFIGDVHGCYDELLDLLGQLGYAANEEGLYVHPEGRRFVSVGDVMSRGPRSLDCMIFFKRHVDANLCLMIDSNHGWKVARWLDGRKVTLSHGDEKVAAEFEQYQQQFGEEETNQLKRELKDFLLNAPSHYVFLKNGVRVVVAAHAGIKDNYIGKQSHAISDFCRYGDTDGVDERGKPIRKDWYAHHERKELIIWGHDPKPQALLMNNTLNIDQGVVFGGMLTGFRYPERTFFSVKAKQDYSETTDNPIAEWKSKRLNPPNIARFINGYSVLTEQYGEINTHNSVVKAAIDSISHYTVPIEELIYIPPTMSPTPEPSKLPDYLEHPQEAFDYYRSHGVETMVVEKKHMGSRGILLLFKNKEAAVQYVGRPTLGAIYTRKGRPFFSKETEQQIIDKIVQDLQCYFYEQKTDYVLLDAEILPWNVKAKELISTQYAHVGEAALLHRLKLIEKLQEAQKEGREVGSWLDELYTKAQNVNVFREVFQKYCWNTNGMDGIQIAPFHLLAHSNQTFFDKSHIWHMEKNREFSSLSELFIPTEFMVVKDQESMEQAINWWSEMTKVGHEGFVVKPEQFISRNQKGQLLQPAIKVRGRNYLHIIYGIDYLLPENLERLKKRSVGKKQRHALMEFALGIEGIKRFVTKDSLERIHECVLATLALEEEAVDPRL